MKGHVLITGGSGTFGRAMTSRLLAMREAPDKVTILSRDEVKQAQMREEFHHDHRLRFTLGDVRDPARLAAVLPEVDYVFHAAALKRIEACAYDPTEAIQTNVVGSMNLLRAAIHAGVKKVVALSSDKAAAPSTTYGATKLCMEAVFASSGQQAHRVGHGTACCVMRYGNVAGSRGSVIPTWRAAIAEGRPPTLFDAKATRFWFTIEGAVDLALWSLQNMTGGETFVPWLPSFYLRDLALAMTAKVEGVSVYKVIPRDRPGEKRHEVMISEDEASAFRRLPDVDWSPGLTRIYARRIDEPQGEPLPEGFKLSSEQATLGALDLADLVRKVHP